MSTRHLRHLSTGGPAPEDWRAAWTFQISRWPTCWRLPKASFAEEAEKEALGTVISAPRITIREKIALIAERLGRNPNTTFNSLLGKKPTRLEVVVTFLALLELVKRYRVSARQAGLFSDIEIEKMEDWGKDEELEIEFE